MPNRTIDGVLTDALGNVYADEFTLGIVPVLSGERQVAALDPADADAMPLNPAYETTGATYAPRPRTVTITSGRTTFQLLESDDPDGEVLYEFRLRGTGFAPATISGVRCPNKLEHPDPLYLWQLVKNYSDYSFVPVQRGSIRPSDLSAENFPLPSNVATRATGGDVFTWVDQRGGPAGAREIYFASGARAVYVPAEHVIDVALGDHPVVANELFIIPRDLDRDNADLSLRITALGVVNTQPLEDFDGNRLSARRLTPGRLYATLRVLPDQAFRVIDPIAVRPQDYLFVVAQSVDNMLTPAVIDAANSSNTDTVTLNLFDPDMNEWLWLGVPADSWEITGVGFSTRPTPPYALALELGFDRLADTVDYMGIPYRWWARKLALYQPAMPWVVTISQPPPPF